MTAFTATEMAAPIATARARARKSCKRRVTGCRSWLLPGQLSYVPRAVSFAGWKRLHRRNPKTGQRLSLRAIAAELSRQGQVNIHGRPYAAESIQAMVLQR